MCFRDFETVCQRAESHGYADRYEHWLQTASRTVAFGQGSDGQLLTSAVRHIRWVGASSLDGIGHRLTVRLSFIHYCVVVTEDKEINE